MSNDETANSMQQKITKRQNERRNPEKVVVVKVNENNELDFVWYALSLAAMSRVHLNPRRIGDRLA
jgi:hypothetical protein